MPGSIHHPGGTTGSVAWGDLPGHDARCGQRLPADTCAAARCF